MTLLIDGNASIHIVYNAILNKFREVPGPFFEDTEDGGRILVGRGVDMFREFYTNYLLGIMGTFSRKLDKVYLVFDTPTYWRSAYLNWYFKQDSHKDETSFIYKDRVKTDDDVEKRKDLSAIFRYIDGPIMDGLNKIEGLSVIKARGAEGDDIITYLAEELTDNMVIWSTDSDLAQLVQNNENKYVFLVTPRRGKTDRKVYISESFTNPYEGDGIDFIDLLNDDVNMINPMDTVDYLTDYCDHKLIQYDPIIDLFAKVLAGDKKSDNIPSVYTWKSSSDKNMSLTEKKAKEIIEVLLHDYKKNELLDLLEMGDEVFLDKIIELIRLKYKLDPGNITLLDRIKFNIKLNHTLIRLKRSVIPKVINTNIKTAYEENKLTKSIDLAQYKLVFHESI